MAPVYYSRARTGFLLLCLLFAGCATEVYRVPTKFSASSESGAREMIVTQVTEVTSSAGYTQTFKAGSKWRYMGRIPEGRVYAIKDDVFMIEGKHMHEAQCVLAEDSLLVGFYLPVEQAFAPLSSPVQLPVTFR